MVDVAVGVKRPDGQALTERWTLKATPTEDGKPAFEAEGGKLVLPDEDAAYTAAMTVPDDYVPVAGKELVVKDGKAKPERLDFALEAPTPAEVTVSVKGPDDSEAVARWTVEVTADGAERQTLTKEGDTASLAATGEYTFTLMSVGAKHVVPDEDHVAKPPVKVTRSEDKKTLAADPTALEWRVSAQTEAKGTGPLVNPAAAIMAILTVAFGQRSSPWTRTRTD